MIDSHVIELGTWSGDRRNVTIKFLDDGQEVYELDFFGPPALFDDAFAIALYPQVDNALAEREFSLAVDLVEAYQNPDTITTYMVQTDFDRRVLGYIMTLVDCHKIDACLPFWQAVQPRNGSNASQRAASLGVTQESYDEVENRFNLYFGVSTFLTNDLAAVWFDVGDWK